MNIEVVAGRFFAIERAQSSIAMFDAFGSSTRRVAEHATRHRTPFDVAPCLIVARSH
jgi:hypothetical protein